MKRLLSTSCSDWAFNIGTLVLRLGAGGLVIAHGYDKLVHFATLRHQFMNFMGIGSSTSLTLVIFAEFFCGLLVLLGLFTRLTVIPIVISMAVALVKAHHSDVFGAGDGRFADLFSMAIERDEYCRRRPFQRRHHDEPDGQ